MMNKIKDLTLSFFLAPITAFFLPKVYKDAARASWRKGACYSAYGALIFTILVTAIFLERSSRSDQFFTWIRDNAPTVIWSPQGLSLENGQKTAKLIHPTYGPVVTFDMDRDAVTKEDIGSYLLFVTSQRIVFRKPLGELEDRDVTKTTFQTPQSLPTRVRVTGELIEKLYQKIRNTILTVTPVLTFVAASLVILFVNGLYALVGLLLNELRSQKLNVSGILNLACFSTGTSLAVTGIIMIGILFAKPLPVILVPISLLVSLLYMVAAIIFVEKPASPLPQTSSFPPNSEKQII